LTVCLGIAVAWGVLSGCVSGTGVFDLDEFEDDIEMIDSLGLADVFSADDASSLFLLLLLLLVGVVCLLINYCKLNPC
jgi:hypothetical protein